VEPLDVRISAESWATCWFRRLFSVSIWDRR
jgi:hypothetical protein